MEQSYPKGVKVIFGVFTSLMAAAGTIQGLIVLYLTTHFSWPDGNAYSLAAAYSSATYVTALYGGYIGERFLGQHSAIKLGFLVGTLGLACLLITKTQFLLLALAMFAIGIGLIQPNIYCLLGKLYDVGDARRDSGFTIAYTGMNLGALIGFIAGGYLQALFNYRIAFALAMVFFGLGGVFFWFTQDGFPNKMKMHCYEIVTGMIAILLLIPVVYVLLHYYILFRYLVIWLAVAIALGLLTYIFKNKHKYPLETKKLLLFLALGILSVTFWSFYMLQHTVIILFIARNVDRMLLNFNLPPAAILALNPIYMLLLGPALSALWLFLNKRKIPVHAPIKFSLGIIFLGLSFLALAAGIIFANAQGQSVLIWIALYFLLFSIGEMIFAPIGYGTIGLLIPERFHSVMLGVWQLTFGTAAMLSGVIAQLVVVKPNQIYDVHLTNPLYLKAFLSFGLFVILIGVFSIFLNKKFLSWMSYRTDKQTI